MKLEKKILEEELHERETKTKVQSTLALAALEKKHIGALKDLEIKHKKAIDELRGLHSIESSNMKKVIYHLLDNFSHLKKLN
jgi:hypothetical protein